MVVECGFLCFLFPKTSYWPDWTPSHCSSGMWACLPSMSCYVIMFCLPHQAFRCLVDRVGLGSLVPVEFFGSKSFEFLPDNKSVKRFEVCTPNLLNPSQPQHSSSLYTILLHCDLCLCLQVDKDINHKLLLENPTIQNAISSWWGDFELQEIFRKGE